jgi:uracil-DNA glycosylase
VVDGRTVVALYHPAAALHQQSLRATLEEDFRKLPRFIDEAKTRSGQKEQPGGENPPQQLSLF